MDRQAVYEQLKIDEGVEYEIYLDHLGYPTFGVGHLVLESDPNSLNQPELQLRSKELRSVRGRP